MIIVQMVLFTIVSLAFATSPSPFTGAAMIKATFWIAMFVSTGHYNAGDVSELSVKFETYEQCMSVAKQITTDLEHIVTGRCVEIAP